MPLIKSKSPEAFKHNLKAEMAAGKPMKQSLAIAYAQKRKKMAHGGTAEYEPSMDKMEEEDTEQTHDLGEAHHVYAHGGDIVEHIMRKHYSEGGVAANEGEDELSDMADGKPNEFDDLVLDDHLESHNSGAADGDALGNHQEDEDRHDIVARVMRQRSMKKNHNPRPA